MGRTRALRAYVIAVDSFMEMIREEMTAHPENVVSIRDAKGVELSTGVRVESLSQSSGADFVYAVRFAAMDQGESAIRKDGTPLAKPIFMFLPGAPPGWRNPRKSVAFRLGRMLGKRRQSGDKR